MSAADASATPLPPSQPVALPSADRLTGPFAGAMPEGPDVTLRAAPFGSLVQVVAWPQTIAEVNAALTAAACPTLPAPGRSTTAAGVAALAIAPNRALLVGERADLAASFEALAPDVGVATDLTHARARLTLSGPRARFVLAKGLAIDLSSDRFPAGTVAVSQIDHIGLVIHAVDADTMALCPVRSFARALVDWLAVAMAPDGADPHTRSAAVPPR